MGCKCSLMCKIVATRAITWLQVATTRAQITLAGLKKVMYDPGLHTCVPIAKVLVLRECADKGPWPYRPPGPIWSILAVVSLGAYIDQLP